MGPTVIQMTMAADDGANAAKRSYVAITLPRKKLPAAMAAVNVKTASGGAAGLRVVASQ